MLMGLPLIWGATWATMRLLQHLGYYYPGHCPTDSHAVVVFLMGQSCLSPVLALWGIGSDWWYLMTVHWSRLCWPANDSWGLKIWWGWGSQEVCEKRAEIFYEMWLLPCPWQGKHYHLHLKSWEKWELPWWSSGKESTFQCRGHGFDPYQGTKILHAAAQFSLHATATEPLHCNEKLTCCS